MERPPLADHIEDVVARVRANPRPAPEVRPPNPEVEAWRSAALERKADELWAATIPPRFRSAALEGIAPDGRAAVEGWMTGPAPRPNLLLTGPVGVGKTWAACASVRPVIRSGFTVLFSPLVELLDKLRPGGDPLIWEDACTVDVLVLDDLGAERPTDWTAERLYGLLNRRWLEERPIVATTNLKADALAEALGERSYSRLVGGAVVVRFSGPDRRRKTS